RHVAGRSLDGLDISTRGRASGSLDCRKQESKRRCAEDPSRQARMGRKHQIAHSNSGCAEDDERQAGLDTEARRCGARAADRREGLDPAAARKRECKQQAKIVPAAKSLEKK